MLVEVGRQIGDANALVGVDLALPQRRMRRLLRDQEGGVLRVLASAAQYHGQNVLTPKEEEEYGAAYNYLLKHSQEMAYSTYKQAGLPLGRYRQPTRTPPTAPSMSGLYTHLTLPTNPSV